MKIAKYPVLFLIGIMNALFVTAENATKNSTESDTWALLGRETRKLWSDCKKVNTSLTNCLERGSLKVLDKILIGDKIPLIGGFSLVQNKNGNTSGNWMTAQERNFNDIDKEKSFLGKVGERLKIALKNHNLRFDLQNLFSYNQETARHRRRNQMGYMMMMFAVGTMMFIGFQFLAVLGGKAFLMAKLALLLASINGLKRIASSGVHYGLYHTAPEHQHPGFGYIHGFSERDAPSYHHPRSN